MTYLRKLNLFRAAFICLFTLIPTVVWAADDPLPSWNDGKSKQSILDFVAKVTAEGSPDFIPIPERIATFDNDGTLWAEQPMYFQLLFALDRVKTLAPQHSEWKDQEPFASLLKGDVKGALAEGEPALLKIVMAQGRLVAPWVAVGDLVMARRQLLNLARLAEQTSPI